MTPGSGVVRVDHLTKHFGTVRAVEDLSFEVAPGRVTGFLGPNGAGKTTTLRMLLGLVRPTAGTATIDGHAYRDIPHPMRVVGAALEASSFHPGRSARDHLRVLAPQVGVPDARADEVLALVGLTDAANRRVGGFSLGMRQRLGFATTLLGDPQVLLLDEPANGLDPEGIAWLRSFLRHLAGQGRTVLVSSHVLAEVQQTVDDILIIHNGQLVTSGTVEALSGGRGAVVRTSDPERLAGALRVADVRATPGADDTLVVDTTDLRLVGDVALHAGLPVWELRAKEADLEELFFALTDGGNRNLGGTAPEQAVAAPVTDGEPR